MPASLKKTTANFDRQFFIVLLLQFFHPLPMLHSGMNARMKNSITTAVKASSKSCTSQPTSQTMATVANATISLWTYLHTHIHWFEYNVTCRRSMNYMYIRVCMYVCMFVASLLANATDAFLIRFLICGQSNCNWFVIVPPPKTQTNKQKHTHTYTNRAMNGWTGSKAFITKNSAPLPLVLVEKKKTGKLQS